MSVSVDFDIEQGVTCPIDEEEIYDICELVLREEAIERPCFVSVTVVEDGRIRELNREWRGQDRPTDVVSLECERPDDPGLAVGEPCELGDIVLAPNYIERQAATFGSTPADEFRLLLVHGLLHLLGYDHLEDEEAEEMERREDELVALLHTEGAVRRVKLTRHAGDDAP